VLINGAAVFRPYLIEEASDDMIVDSVMTNLAGPMLTARAGVPLLNRDGHIINVSSETVVVPLPYLSAYEATKAGVERFSQALQDELLVKGIRVTVVRAGQMVGPGASNQIDAVTGARFFEAAAKKGLDPMTRGATQYQSTTQIFRTIIDSPPDLHVGIVTFDARIAR
jgi:NAD(P)-dependent dehydrogenase (short-subunit alcohol dehydrogenase family)